MIKKSELVINDLLEHQVPLQELLDAQINVINLQNQQIRILEEKIEILESSNKEISECIKQFAADMKKVE